MEGNSYKDRTKRMEALMRFLCSQWNGTYTQDWTKPPLPAPYQAYQSQPSGNVARAKAEQLLCKMLDEELKRYEGGDV